MQNGLAVSYGCGDRPRGRICVGVHIKFMAGSGDMGLHREIRQYTGADMRAVRDIVVFPDAVCDMGRGLSQMGILERIKSIYAFKHIQRTFYI